jgi:hypothetical protein
MVDRYSQTTGDFFALHFFAMHRHFSVPVFFCPPFFLLVAVEPAESSGQKDGRTTATWIENAA